MQYGMLGSGSTGNGLWIQAEHGLLVDCGFSAREALRRLRQLEADPERIRGILVTHEHGDHGGGAGRMARRLNVPILATPGTLAGLRDVQHVELVPIATDSAQDFAGFSIGAFDVPHDSTHPVGLSIGHNGSRLAFLTDCGHWDQATAQALQDHDALIVEANHDTDLLARGPYPEPLKRRIHGPHGHLSNHDAARLLEACLTPRTRRVILTHLSRYNNTPELALASTHAHLERSGVAVPKMVASGPADPTGPFACR